MSSYNSLNYLKFKIKNKTNNNDSKLYIVCIEGLRKYRSEVRR